MLKKNLVLLSYGRISEYQRAIFSILSFYSWSDEADLKKVRTIVYTDDPSFFRKHLSHIEIEYVMLTNELLMEMLGDSDYIHRRKVGVIDLTFKKYPAGHLLFIDSDTFFIGNPAKILNGFSTGTSFMHKREYNFEEGLQFFSAFNQGKYPKAFINYISDRDFVVNGKTERFSKHDYSWNSGVLGLNAAFSACIPDVFKLTDEFYVNSQWFISEQLAFALVLQKTTAIVPTEELVLHYWGKRQKVLMDAFIGDLFPDQINELKEKSYFRSLTYKLKKNVEDDLVLEQAVLALSQKHWKYGLRKSLQVILRNPVRLTSYKELLSAVKPES
ncbi:hypothetical protein DBR43_16230 [Pedobacter sp. KBW06]|uniref:hypothetical protein n=1 Tax=Pedobacter sp. KBW06 TaxID=2153359 RepID=UPI000F5A4F8E|nr:hypothetical protein [Pedobacter sp. KBW06]RQO69619.1 hypothetical protein DBR43_16230 [Pedobacter sp. KBW06]